jgi:hypothetical protein
MIRRLLATLALLACATAAHAQATVQLTPDAQSQYFDNNGNPLSFGKLCTYITGTNTAQPTYTDYTGTVQNTNPVVLDIAGRGNVWWDILLEYRVVLRNAGTTNDCTTGTIIWTVDGVKAASGVNMVGNLPPLFTTSVSGTTLSFALSNAAAHTIFGNNSGVSGAPSYGGIGIDKQIAYNCGGNAECGSTKLTWDDSDRTLHIQNGSGTDVMTFHVNTGDDAGEIAFDVVGGRPRIKNETTIWQFTSKAGQDIQFGPNGDPEISYIMGGGGAIPVGTFRVGEASHFGDLYLNDGNSVAGVFSGAQVIMGFIADPEGTVSAETGSMFLTTNGGAGATLWVKESSPTANTGWIAK